ncbi:membrane associated protein [hydrocarbon metagenome]|uniref:Membrane associated protein n=1 Tax=hydrocarbon metagenome TaxID=938273 RepID=A0A0W8E2H3_9ZZZZ
MKKNDILLIGIIIVISLAALLFINILGKGDRITAVVSQNNTVIERIDLSTVKEPRTITVSGDYHNIIKVEKDRIRFEKSDCPEQICVHTGWLTKYGDIAVCMPNKTIIDIEKK